MAGEGGRLALAAVVAASLLFGVGLRSAAADEALPSQTEPEPPIYVTPNLPPPPPPRAPPAPPAPAPAFAPQPLTLAPGLPPGPVTNYGTGGMQAMPGASPNPPYPPGGLLH